VSDAPPRRAVFLDRDGVLNRATSIEGRPHPPRSSRDLEVLPGVAEACASLRSAGLLLIVVTNQPDVARGTADRATIEQMNDEIKARLAIDDVLVCWHDDADRCSCRKPRPGLLLEAADRWRIDLASSVMVGDRWRDIEAGRSAGCLTVFVDHRWAEPPPTDPDLTVAGLFEATSWIVARLTDART
jgi:D-glycero-D-manno-heptose 1,7-bisphosphate phosphatase